MPAWSCTQGYERGHARSNAGRHKARMNEIAAAISSRAVRSSTGSRPIQPREPRSSRAANIAGRSTCPVPSTTARPRPGARVPRERPARRDGPWPRRAARPACGSSSWRSTARPSRSRRACPCRGMAGSGPWRRAACRPPRHRAAPACPWATAGHWRGPYSQRSPATSSPAAAMQDCSYPRGYDHGQAWSITGLTRAKSRQE